MHLVEWVIPEDLACQILAESASDSVFSIGQERFNSLPNTCEGKPEQKYKGVAGRIEDASTTTILEYLTGTKRKIQFYGAETYYAVCDRTHQHFWNRIMSCLCFMERKCKKNKKRRKFGNPVSISFLSISVKVMNLSIYAMKKLPLIILLALGMGIFSCQKELTENMEHGRAQKDGEMPALTKSAQKHYYKELKGRMIRSIDSKFSQLIMEKAVGPEATCCAKSTGLRTLEKGIYV